MWEVLTLSAKAQYGKNKILPTKHSKNSKEEEVTLNFRLFRVFRWAIILPPLFLLATN